MFKVEKVFYKGNLGYTEEEMQVYVEHLRKVFQKRYPEVDFHFDWSNTEGQEPLPKITTDLGEEEWPFDEEDLEEAFNDSWELYNSSLPEA